LAVIPAPAVIVRLDRATRYSGTPAIESQRCGVLDTRLRGYDALLINVAPSHYFLSGDICRLRPEGLSANGRNAFSPRVPVAIRKDAASRIATVSAAVTSTTGDFIVVRSRCKSSRLIVQKNVAQEFRMARIK
jgi:hypothetical protein